MKNENMSLNVFKNASYKPMRYPANWFFNIKQWFKGWKYAYQRVTKGYCDMDVWDLGYYYSNLFHVTLTQLADITHTYPAAFDSYEEWQKALREAAEHFYVSNEANNALPTPESDKYYGKHPIYQSNEFKSEEYLKVFEEYVANSRKRAEHLEEGLKFLHDWFNDLWD